jgi:hypothetical protein
VVARQEHIQNQQADEGFGLQEEGEEGASAREPQPDSHDENADRWEGDQGAASQTPERELTESRRDEGQERRDRRIGRRTRGGDLRGTCEVSLRVPSAD